MKKETRKLRRLVATVLIDRQEPAVQPVVAKAITRGHDPVLAVELFIAHLLISTLAEGVSSSKGWEHEFTKRMLQP